MNKEWKQFMKSGSVNDYLKYKEELAKDTKFVKHEPKGSNSNKKPKLQRNI